MRVQYLFLVIKGANALRWKTTCNNCALLFPTIFSRVAARFLYGAELSEPWVDKEQTI